MVYRRLNRSGHPLFTPDEMARSTWALSARVFRSEDPAVNYYKRHIGDYARKTAHLDFLEDAAYNRLLDIYYDREAPIPDAEAERLCRARSSSEKKAVRRVLNEFFVLVDGSWVNERCEKEIGKLGQSGDASRENGKLGGRPKKTKQVQEKEPNGNLAGFEKEPANNLTPRLQDSKTQEPLRGIPVDPRKQLFELGKSILGASSGGLISQAISRTSEAKVGEVLGHMALSSKADPKAYFVAATTPAERGLVM